MTVDVVLRDVLDSDLDIFFEYQSEPCANNMAAFMPRDPADREAFSAHWTKILADGTVTIKTIVFEGRVAGNVASFELLSKQEVCYWIGKEYWGKGIATASLTQLLTQIKIRPLFAGVARDNRASIRVLEKCGFLVIGHQRSFSRARGEEIDEVLMKLE